MAAELIHGHRRFSPAPGISDLDVDPYAVEHLLDPYTYYRTLREAGPVVHLPGQNMLAVGRLDVTREVFKDHEQFGSSRGVGLDDFQVVEPLRPLSIILEVDPPEHNRSRRVLANAMSRSAVADLESSFTAVAHRLVDAGTEGEMAGGIPIDPELVRTVASLPGRITKR